MEGSTGARRVGTTGDTSGDVDRDGKGGKKRSLAQLFCLIAGLTLLVVGIIGFFVENGGDFALPDSLNPGARGELFGLFDINGWENIVHIASGALLLFASAKANLARTVALIFGVVYALVAVLGWIDSEDVLGILPVNTEGNLLHTALAAASLLAALLPTKET